ncbi:MAG: BatD family protein, partial [Polyangiaceae bacterium]
VGDRIQLHLVAKSSTSLPSDPQLLANSTIFESSGASITPTQSITVVNGTMSSENVLLVDWTLLAKQQGTATFTPRIKIEGKLVQSNPVSITVVAAGTAPPPTQQRRPFDPFGGLMGPMGGAGGTLNFDPFSMLNGGNPDPQTQPMQPVVPLESKLALPAPRGSVAFLHALADKTTAVVGEQVTYSVYLYVDPDQREPDFNDVHESTAADFIKQNLIDDAKDNQAVQYATVGGKIWGTKLIRKWALFPLKTGLLEIGSMRLAVVGARGANAARGSEPLVIKIDDPPIAGRPPGYVSGNVGVFQVQATVAPKAVDRGGAIAVDVDLSGTGNLPTNITPPPQQGVDWLTPEVRDNVAASKTGVFGGSRRFSFVVHLNKPGSIDLGEIAIPYFDPDQHTYGVARAALGVVTVKAGANAATDAAAQDDDPLSKLPPLQPGFSREAPRAHLADRPIFWLALLFSPLSFVVVAGGRSVSRRLRSSLEFRRASPDSLLTKRISDAKSACKENDSRAADAAIVKMIEQGAIVRAGVNVRALTIDEIEDHLAVRGVARAAAEEIADILRACEGARFLPEAGNIETSRERLARAIAALDELGKKKKLETA